MGAEGRVSPEAAPYAPVLSGRRRLVRAYWATFVVASSYLWLRWTSWLRGPESAREALLACHKRNAQRICRVIDQLQGLYIKVGQLLSILTNVLPPEFRRELEGLQDHIPPRPTADIRRRLQEAFGERFIGEVFAEFDETPVASASIAQVHRARLLSGEAVAVKVQYPDVEEMVRLDLRAMRFIFRLIHRFIPHYGLDRVYEEIRGIVLEEIDFTKEADNRERIAANFVDREDIRFPQVYREFSTDRVLTTEWIDGFKASDTARIDAAEIDRGELARKIVAAYCQQIFTDGVYHADPHPGNLMVLPGPVVVFLDFGAVAEVAPSMREGLVEIIQGALTRDTDRISRALRLMGFVAREADPRLLERIVEYFHNTVQEQIQLDSFNLKDIRIDPEKGLEHLADLRKMDISLLDLTEQFHVPRQWIMLERTILLLMGLCTELDPDMSPMEVIRPYLESFVLGEDQDATQLMLNTTRDLALTALALPGELKKFLTLASQGRLEVRFLGLDEGVHAVYTVGHQLIYTVLTVSGGAFAILLHDRGWTLSSRLALGGAAFFGLLLAGSLAATRSRIRRARRGR